MIMIRGLVLSGALLRTALAAAGPSQPPPTDANEQQAWPSETASRDDTGWRVIRAIHLTEPLRIDGKLDEEVYQVACERSCQARGQREGIN